ncbi:hypothetical protein OUZ56_017555 [Daphnia magna]|uniref:Uncharacterized protein n=1 Tax=Daphnia magna TaxID=35525 RepID=A0ABR0AT28_9CRUS|nr:hypothetical protein OUZ56_017555 [Daphnia magna]
MTNLSFCTKTVKLNAVKLLPIVGYNLLRGQEIREKSVEGFNAGHHVTDLVVTTEPIDGRFCSPDAFHFTEVTKMDAVHYLSSQRYWNDESFSIKDDVADFTEGVAHIPIRPGWEWTVTLFVGPVRQQHFLDYFQSRILVSGSTVTGSRILERDNMV